MLELLALLLPLAAASGWYVAHRQHGQLAQSRPPYSYYRDLDQLLTQRTDKAIPIVEELLRQYPDAIETQIALGVFFRKQGEGHKAISLHEKLLDNPNLQESQRNDAYLELGMDYMKAGLLDRAESIFKALTATTHRIQALHQLLHIYQQEKDWSGAMSCTLEIRRLLGVPLRGETESQFLCELAVEADARGDDHQARDYVRRAQKSDPGNVRAFLIQTEFALREGRYAEPLPALIRLSQEKIEYLPVILPLMKRCCEHLNDLTGYRNHLAQLQARYASNEASLALCELIQQTEGSEPAEEYLSGVLLQRSSLDGLIRLLELKRQNHRTLTPEDISSLAQLMKGLYSNGMYHLCEQCGFEGTELHWCCPSCRHWATIKPQRQKIPVR
jgi:lipopolysaccharide biosynthesis regulator YciM